MNLRIRVEIVNASITGKGKDIKVNWAKVCPNCGTGFYSGRIDRRTCSAKCRQQLGVKMKQLGKSIHQKIRQIESLPVE